MEWDYFSISPHRGLAYQNNVIEVQAHLPPTPASRVRVFFASWPFLEVTGMVVLRLQGQWFSF